MHVQLRHPQGLMHLQQQSRRQRDAKQRDRYRAVLVAVESHDAPATARALGRSRAFVQRWVQVYRDRRFEAIAPGRPPKRPPAGSGDWETVTYVYDPARA